MPVKNEAIEAGGVMPPAEVKVWDPFVRIFHWSLFTLCVFAFATGDEWTKPHIAAGYAIALLVAFRVAWGFIGSRHARFADFVRGPRVVAGYIAAILRGHGPRHLGHNPAGGAMIVALLATLAATCFTGLMLTTDAFWGSQWMEDAHSVCTNALLVLVALHLGGVVVSSVLHHENLVTAMFTGQKRKDG